MNRSMIECCDMDPFSNSCFVFQEPYIRIYRINKNTAINFPYTIDLLSAVLTVFIYGATLFPYYYYRKD